MEDFCVFEGRDIARGTFCDGIADLADGCFAEAMAIIHCQFTDGNIDMGVKFTVEIARKVNPGLTVEDADITCIKLRLRRDCYRSIGINILATIFFRFQRMARGSSRALCCIAFQCHLIQKEISGIVDATAETSIK